MSSLPRILNFSFIHNLRDYLDPKGVAPTLLNYSPNGKTARKLLTELHSGELNINYASAPEVNLATSAATIDIYVQKILKSLLSAIKKDVREHDSNAIPENKAATSLETVLGHRESVKHDMASILRAPIEDAVNGILDQILINSPQCPFAFLHRFKSQKEASQRQTTAIKNLWGGFGTGIKFIEVLTSEIARLLPEGKQDPDNFFKVAYNLSPLLKQFAMLHVRFIEGEEALHRTLLVDDPRLELQDDRLVYNIEGLTNPDELIPEHGLIKDPRIEKYVHKLAKTASKMPEYKSLFGQIQYPFQMGCPAINIQIPTKDVPKVLLPDGFKKNRLGLIDLLLFHYLYLLKRESLTPLPKSPR